MSIQSAFLGFLKVSIPFSHPRSTEKISTIPIRWGKSRVYLSIQSSVLPQSFRNYS